MNDKKIIFVFNQSFFQNQIGKRNVFTQNTDQPVTKFQARINKSLKTCLVHSTALSVRLEEEAALNGTVVSRKVSDRDRDEFGREQEAGLGTEERAGRSFIGSVKRLWKFLGLG